MLLSRANLDRLEEEPKLDRIKLYVQDQKDRLPYYKSPGSVSVPESCINDGSDNDEALSASISEIERRKYRSSMHHNSRIEFSPLEIAVESKLNNNQNVKRTRNSHRREKDEQEKDSCASQLVRKRKRMKPDTTSEVRTASSSKLLPQSKSKGFHLLQKFVSPNLEINRITIKSNYHRPKLGLFNKGKSSANGKTVPDLVFSESQFLRPRQPPQVSHTPGAKSPEASSSIFGPARSRQPSNSRFFPPKLNENKQSRLSSDYSKQPSPSTALKKPPPAAAKQNRSTYTTSIINRPRDIQALFAQQQRQASASPRQDQHQIREEQLPTQRNKDKDYPTVPNNKSTCSTSSLESIQRLLKECQQPPESSCTSNSYHPYENQQQVPYYSHARSPPDQITRTYAAVSDYYKPWSPNIVFYNPDTATLDNNHPSPEEDDDHSSENAQAPNNAMRDLPFGLNWQVLDSVASFHPANNYPNHQQKKKDDLDLILASPAMRMVNRSNENEDDNLQNFWLTQSYKRKL